MTLRHEVTLLNGEGTVILTNSSLFTSEYAIESITGCEALVRELQDYVREYHVEPPLPTTPEVAWELFVDAALHPTKLSDGLRRTLMRAYLGPLSATITRARPDGTRHVPLRRPPALDLRTLIIHDTHLFGLIHSAGIASMTLLREREPALS